MGPQSSDCGNVAQSLFYKPGLRLAVLQWGRSRQTAETSRLLYLMSRRLHDFASMGPQSSDCGNVWMKRHASATNPGFNGAAVVRLRKHGQRHTPRRRSGSFNGAAVVRLRKPSFHPASRSDSASLQWGRSRQTAETASRLSYSVFKDLRKALRVSILNPAHHAAFCLANYPQS